MSHETELTKSVPLNCGDGAPIVSLYEQLLRGKNNRGMNSSAEKQSKLEAKTKLTHTFAKKAKGSTIN